MNKERLDQFLAVVRAGPEYAAVKRYYGDRTAERSGVPLINHIDQGIAIIWALGGNLPVHGHFAPMAAAEAYCLHPLFQNDAELMREGWLFVMQKAQKSAMAVMLAMEYRARANAWLSDKVTPSIFTSSKDLLVHEGEPDPGLLEEVIAMLIADKVQNYKDFKTYHQGTHPRSRELTEYFTTWLEALRVDPLECARLTGVAQLVS